MTDTLPAVHLDSVRFQYQSAAAPALQGLSMTVRAGQITGLVGPDAAGKTTLMRLMGGLLAPTDGTVRVFGMSTVEQPDAVREATGYMPQRFGLYDDLSVLENMNLYADLRNVTGKDRQESFERLLRLTDLTRFTERLAGRLSGGMKQKLGLACALICRPRLLLLDEPSVGVDPVSRRELWRMVRELVDGDTAVVWSTSYLDEAEQCDEALLLNNGEALFYGKPAELTARVLGRSFWVGGLSTERRRKVLTRAMSHPSVMDGVVQGSKLRLLLTPDTPFPPLEEIGISANETGIEVAVTSPRFEDAFIDILGGSHHSGHSDLADHTPTVPDDGVPSVTATGLTKRFGNFTAVENNSFDIRRGEIYGLLGPNGAGKSTTFKMMCGLLRPTEGHGEVAGVNLRHSASQARAKLGYMAQKFSLYADLSVHQNLKFFAGIYGLDKRECAEAIELVSNVFDLRKYHDTSAKDLTPGYKQRLSLACAVMHHPPVLFLDEPTGSVDPITRREFWTHINGLVDRGVTVLVTTHFMDEAEYCDRIGLIYRGRKVAEGTPDELKAGARSAENPDPSLEDAFITMVRREDEEKGDA